MRTAYEEDLDEDEIAHSLYPTADRELTLSFTTVLAIFFGLVLICGLFFGFGYTLGRRSPVEAISSNSPGPAYTAVTPQPSESRPKPSAASPVGTVTLPDSPAPQPEPITSETYDAPSSSSPEQTIPAPATVQAKPHAAVLETVAETKPQSKPSDPTATSPQQVKAAFPIVSPPVATQSAVPGIMVQIAAISNPTDAAVLVGALHKHGYSAVTRREPNDTLIHVQVGPFSTRAEGIAMKQKLLSDGYNAILK